MTKLVRDNPVLSFLVLALGGSWIVWSPWWLTLNGIGLIWVEFSNSVIVVVHVLGLFAGPFAAALIVSRIVDGRGAPLRLLSRMVQWRENPLWYVVALVMVPMAMAAGYIAFPGGPGTPSAAWSVATLVLMFVGLLVAGPIQEEIGWRGFALPRMQTQMHPTLAALALGLVVFVWQVPLMITFAWNRPFDGFADVGVYIVFLVATSIVLSTLRNAANGSLLLPILAYNAVNWSLYAVPLLTSTELDSLVPATFGMSVLAVVALILTGGRLAAGGAPGASKANVEEPVSV